MDSHESLQLEVEQPAHTRKEIVGVWLRRIFTLDERPNEKQHRPVFSVVMTVLHVCIHLLAYIASLWQGPRLVRSLTQLWMVFVPCMKPVSAAVRVYKVDCASLTGNGTCYYDDALRKTCSSFLYPHQLWRMITVNLLHVNGLHLFFNMSKQLLYGILLERRYGSRRVILIYWLSNFGASLTVMTFDPQMSGIGASGALYGIMVFFVVERLSAIKRHANRWPIILAQLVILVVVPMAITVSIANILDYRVGHSAHFGGGLVGFLLAIGMFGCPWPWGDEHCRCQTICRCSAFVFLAVFCMLTIAVFFLTDAPFIAWVSYLS